MSTPSTPLRALLVVLLLSATACGSVSQALDTTDPDTALDTAAEETVELFDASVVHTIDVVFDDEAYDAMIQTYTATGDKESIVATVTIDGVTYEQVGLRLKGNSSLRGVTGQSLPEELPWLIELDEFVDGQDHQAYEDIVIRSNNTETALNEAVALELLEEVGLASQEAVATTFTVNGSDAELRLAIEHPDDDEWYESWFDDADGALYKAESTGDWSYRGDDPEAYDEVFDQEGGSDVADLTPLMDFLQFINETDDATFAAELPDRLDVDAFATYLAMMDLLDNFDDIDGPGNNAYLWWDAETAQFTVVPWDLNLAFGVTNGGGGGGAPGGGGVEPPAGGRGGPGEGGPGVGGAGGPGAGGPGVGGNVLVERFRAVPEFEALYTAQLAALEAELFDSGTAQAVLDGWVQTLTDGAVDLVDVGTLSAEAAAIQAYWADS